MHRIYRGESASRENGATQRSNLLRCSRLVPPEALIQVEGVVSDSATEVREQAKLHFMPHPPNYFALVYARRLERGHALSQGERIKSAFKEGHVPN